MAPGRRGAAGTGAAAPGGCQAAGMARPCMVTQPWCGSPAALRPCGRTSADTDCVNGGSQMVVNPSPAISSARAATWLNQPPLCFQLRAGARRGGRGG